MPLANGIHTCLTITLPTPNLQKTIYYMFIGNGALFAYDSEDTSIRTYYKANPLSDSNISKIAYNKVYHTLVITYSNANNRLINQWRRYL